MTPSTDGSLPAETQLRLQEMLTELRGQRAALASDMESRDCPKDVADAADQIQLGDELARLDDRITELTDQLEGDGIVTGGLAVGSTVTVRFADGVDTLLVVPLPSSKAEATLSAASPLSQALAGHQPGDTVTYRTPAGTSTVELLKVSPPI